MSGLPGPVCGQIANGSVVTATPESGCQTPSRAAANRYDVESTQASTEETAAPTLRATKATGAVIAYCLFAGLLFFDTVASMVSIWLRSQTFAHGFLILPISLWLVWRMRARLHGMLARPEPRALLLVLAAGLAWLLAHLVDVQVIQQLAFVVLIISGIWVIVGTEIARCAAFPLGFLFLAVPMGAGLIPPLMAFTADTTEFLLRASGIPLLREGMYLILPTGTWSVIEECSGVRYLIAFFTLGLLYAWLTYTSPWRRAAFVAAAILVSILVNSVRAYGVVMVGHLSNMRFGIGGEHLIYGWLFFGLVMFLMFWIGGFWQQKIPILEPDPAPATAIPHKPALSVMLATLLALGCAATGPAAALTLNRNPGIPSLAVLAVPVVTGDWQPLDNAKENWHWHPGQGGADRKLDQLYTSNAEAAPLVVGLYLRQYLQQQPGAELVTSIDPWRPNRKHWRIMGHGSAVIDLDAPLQVDEVKVVSPHQSLLLWSWYRIDGRNTANPYIAKLLEGKQQIFEGSRRGTRIFIATPVGDDRTAARALLQQFVSAYHHAIAASLDQDSSEAVDLKATPTQGSGTEGVAQ